MEDEQQVNANQECFYHKYRPGHVIYRVTWSSVEEKFFVAGPFKIIGVMLSIDRDNSRRRNYSLVGGRRATEEDMYFDEQAAIAEAYLRDEKEKQHHAEA